MAKKYSFPEDLEKFKIEIFQILKPISPVSEKTRADKDFLFSAQKTEESKSLPEYYLCYFLFIDLLGFRNLGQFEKVSWSIPIDYLGEAYLLEHRKFGFGLFAKDKETQQADAKVIVILIQKAIKFSKPYFEWRAKKCADNSELNVLNHNYNLFHRFQYHLDEYNKVNSEAIERKDERIITELNDNAKTISIPSIELKRNANWLALSAIDAFFSWTEHVFIHAAILQCKINTGKEVADLAEGNWGDKFKTVLDISNPEINKYYDKLVLIKRQIRNYVAHGAFGKRGEAFSIHTGAGAVPLLMPHQQDNGRFSFKRDLEFQESEALSVINDFIVYYWESEIFPEVIYIKSELPTILTMTKDGTYQKAMISVDEMDCFIEHLSDMHNQAMNMDW